MHVVPEQAAEAANVCTTMLLYPSDGVQAIEKLVMGLMPLAVSWVSVHVRVAVLKCGLVGTEPTRFVGERGMVVNKVLGWELTLGPTLFSAATLQV